LAVDGFERLDTADLGQARLAFFASQGQVLSRIVELLSCCCKARIERAYPLVQSGRSHRHNHARSRIMLQHTARLDAEAAAQELLETDLERVAAVKDGNYWWGSVTSGAAAVEAAQRGQSRELVHGHIK
jgi:hypothetical protein